MVQSSRLWVGSLKDAGNAAVENYISRQDADYYATMYKKDGLTGGHIIFAESAGIGILMMRQRHRH